MTNQLLKVRLPRCLQKFSQTSVFFHLGQTAHSDSLKQAKLVVLMGRAFAQPNQATRRAEDVPRSDSVGVQTFFHSNFGTHSHTPRTTRTADRFHERRQRLSKITKMGLTRQKALPHRPLHVPGRNDRIR